MTVRKWLYERMIGVSAIHALNMGEAGEVVAPDELGKQLKQSINGLKQAAFQAGKVDYAGLREHEAYLHYRHLTRQLQTFPLAILAGDNERVAFWVNLYNALIIDAIIQWGVARSVQEVRGFFAKAAYCVNGYRFSADDIEHGILRANAGHPALGKPQFGKTDPRLQWVVSKSDPRIHFTLVCGADSCPPIAVYQPEELDWQLNAAARAFINSQEVKVDVTKGNIDLSPIFRWYAPDWGGNVWNQLGIGRFDWLVRYLAAYIDDPATTAALRENPTRFKVRFNAYDWGLNLFH